MASLLYCRFCPDMLTLLLYVFWCLVIVGYCVVIVVRRRRHPNEFYKSFKDIPLYDEDCLD